MPNKLGQFIKKRKDKKLSKDTGEAPLGFTAVPPDEVSLSNRSEPAFAQSKKWRFPNWEQCKFILRKLSDKEKGAVVGALFAACTLLAAWGITVYVKDTNRKPALGGSYSEGVQGQPLYLNPIVSHSNPVDSDLSLLIFSSLFRYNSEGKLEQDLVDLWERSDDGLTYTVRLKKDAKWQDGQPLTAEDVLFTLNLIRNPVFGSTLRGNWEGINVEKTDDFALRFTLRKAYTPFLHNLTFGILPKHLWEDITSDKFLLTDLNRKPVGSGMYTFNRLDKNQNGQIMSITLKANNNYYGRKPHLKELIFRFYSSPEEILAAYEKGEIKGISHIEATQAKDAAKESGLEIYDIPTTRIYGVFFNQKKSAIAAEQKVREAINYATDKDELVREALQEKGVVVNSPLTPNMLGFQERFNQHEYSIEKAKSMLQESGWTMPSDKERKKIKDEPKSEGKAMYNAKLKKFLILNLTVPDYPELVKTADLLKKQWEKIGLELNLDIVDTSETLQNKISDRNYEALLFGEVLQADPDPAPFWHSSSKQAPGLNLSLFENQDVDKLLDEARQEVNENRRAELYQKFQEIALQEAPAIFLFSPYYLYGVSDDYQGVGSKVIYNPSGRLNDINNRYLYTTRTRKP